jgi:hypothetical protein
LHVSALLQELGQTIGRLLTAFPGGVIPQFVVSVVSHQQVGELVAAVDRSHLKGVQEGHRLIDPPLPLAHRGQQTHSVPRLCMPPDGLPHGLDVRLQQPGDLLVPAQPDGHVDQRLGEEPILRVRAQQLERLMATASPRQQPRQMIQGESLPVLRVRADQGDRLVRASPVIEDVGDPLGRAPPARINERGQHIQGRVPLILFDQRLRQRIRAVPIPVLRL